MPIINRRMFLRSSAAVLSISPAWAGGRQTEEPKFQVHDWKRDARNPVLPPGPKAFDVGCCMTPFVLRRGDTYWLFYAGADAQGRRRICLATTPIDDLTAWKRRGPLFEPGG